MAGLISVTQMREKHAFCRRWQMQNKLRFTK